MWSTVAPSSQVSTAVTCPESTANTPGDLRVLAADVHDFEIQANLLWQKENKILELLNYLFFSFKLFSGTSRMWWFQVSVASTRLVNLNQYNPFCYLLWNQNTRLITAKVGHDKIIPHETVTLLIWNCLVQTLPHSSSSLHLSFRWDFQSTQVGFQFLRLPRGCHVRPLAFKRVALWLKRHSIPLSRSLTVKPPTPAFKSAPSL